MTQTQIIIVEDEGVVALDIQNRLENNGYHVSAIVNSGEEALRKVEEIQPDLVLMDIHLAGEIDGVEAAEQIQERFHAPVVFLTAYSDDDTLERAKVMEPFGYLLKPFVERELYTAIEMALYKHRAEEDKARLEEQLHQAQKMQAIGQLVAGMAHNFNNQLMVALNSFELALHKGTFDADLLMNGESAVQRAAEMIEHLMVFSRTNTSPETRPIKIQNVLQEVLEICRRTFNEQISITDHLAGDMPLISGNENQLEQVFMNLLLNARDALEEMDLPLPSIEIEVSRVFRRGEHVSHLAEIHPGNYIHICVADNGAGMSEETQKRIFEPFFTTKEVGKGTGLGMATAYSIISKHQGWIEYESQPNKGTTCSVFLPVKEEEFPPLEEPQSPPQDPLRGTETILVVEDDEAVLHTNVEVLHNFGYTTLPAKDGQEGWKQFQCNREKIALVLLDWSMPKISGRDLLDRMYTLDPNVKVILSTGNVDPLGPLEVEAILRKPYSLTQALKTIRNVLDGVDDAEKGH